MMRDAPPDDRGPLEAGPLEPLAPPARFLELAEAHAIRFDEGDLERLGLFLALLLDVNTRTNLTAIRDPEDAWVRHVFDALTLLPVIAEVPEPEDRPLRLADVGAGGGLPGIPLAIARPDVEVSLLEATGKKAEFLRLCKDRLDLRNVAVVRARAEAAGAHERGEHRDRYDVVVARALGRLAVAAELCVPLARVGGIVALVKGEKAEEELDEAGQALHLLHAAHAGTVRTPTGRIVVLPKLRPTPRAYPRRDGEPKRSPLGVGS